MKNIFPYLTYAGAIPFIFCAVCLSVDFKQLPLLGPIDKILSIYALVICSFLAGAHWGQHLHIDGSWSRSLPSLSNIIAVLLWLGFLLFSFKMLMTMFVAAFVILLGIDYRLVQLELITRYYFQTRCVASAIVIVSLIISGIVS